MNARKRSTVMTARSRWCTVGPMAAGPMMAALMTAGMLMSVLLMAGLIGCGSNRSMSSAAQANSSEQAEGENAQADAKALGTIGRRNWYDPDKGEYRPPKPSDDVDHPLRRTGTIAGPRSQTTPAPRGSAAWNWPSGEVVGYTLLIILGVALLAAAISLAVISVRNWKPGRAVDPLRKAIAIDPNRVADLPFEAQSEMQDPLAYAKHLIALGKLDEAIVFIYGYMLLALDRAGKIVLHRGKTNRMYLHELVGEPELRGLLTPAMLAFEDVFFGRHSIERGRFQKIFDQLDRFHRELAPSIAAAKPLEAEVTL